MSAKYERSCEPVHTTEDIFTVDVYDPLVVDIGEGLLTPYTKRYERRWNVDGRYEYSDKKREAHRRHGRLEWRRAFSKESDSREEMLTRVKAGELVPGSSVLIDGRRVLAAVGCATAGELPHCQGEKILIDLEEIPEESGRRESKILWSGTANLSIQRPILHLQRPPACALIPWPSRCLLRSSSRSGDIARCSPGRFRMATSHRRQ
jgi:hypothetical protein